MGKPSVSSRVLSPQVWDNGAAGREPGQGAGPRRAEWEESEPLAHPEKLGLSLTPSSARWVMRPSSQGRQEVIKETGIGQQP